MKWVVDALCLCQCKKNDIFVFVFVFEIRYEIDRYKHMSYGVFEFVVFCMFN